MSPCLRRHTFCQQRQKVYKKRRQKPGFLDFLSAPRTFKIVGVRPTRLGVSCKGHEMQNCLCVCAAAAGGTKCRGVCSDQRGDVGIAPYATRRDVSFICRGRCPRRPERNRNRPTEPLLADRKGIPKPWFRRAFGYFSRTGKATRRRQTQPIQPPALFLCILHIKTQKFSANLYQIPIYITSLK